MSPTILITGGAGFIGSHLAEAWQDRANVRVLDNFRTGKRENLEGFHGDVIDASILDRTRLARAMRGVDFLYHLAAQVSVEESVLHPTLASEINVVGLSMTLEEAAKAGVKFVGFSGSAAVYGDGPDSPKTEDMPPRPRSPYAVTKWAGEALCETMARERGFRTVSLRYFNVHGVRQNPASPYASAIPRFLAQALRGEPLTIFGDGEQTRDFIHVRDVVAANVLAAENASMSGVYNVGSGTAISINETAQAALRVTGSRSEIVHREPRPGDVRHSLADAKKLIQAGWRARVSLEDGLRETAQWIKA